MNQPSYTGLTAAPQPHLLESLRLEAVTCCVGFDDLLDVTLDIMDIQVDCAGAALTLTVTVNNSESFALAQIFTASGPVTNGASLSLAISGSPAYFTPGTATLSW